MWRYPYPVGVPLNMAEYSGLSERPPPWRLPARPSPQKRLSRRPRRPGSDRPARGRHPSRCRCRGCGRGWPPGDRARPRAAPGIRATAELTLGRAPAPAGRVRHGDRAPPSSVPPIHTQRADHRGLQGHGLEPHLGEAGLCQGRLPLPTPGRRGLVAGPRAPRLMGHGYQATAPQQAAELLQRRNRLTPEHRRVDGEDLVERLVEGEQVLGDGAEPQIDHSAPEALGIEPLRPPHHQLGVVDPAHVPLPRQAAKLPYRDARSKADLQHAILRPHVEQGHRPRVPPAVRGAVGHEQARYAPPEAGWAPELGADGGGDPLSQLHGLDSFTPSSGLRRVLAVPNGRLAGPRRRAPPAPTPRRPARWMYRSPRWG